MSNSLANSVLPEIMVDREHDEPIVQAAKYLMMKDRKYTMEKIATAFGYASRSGMYDLVRSWETDGILDKARKEMLLPRVEEIRAAIAQTLDHWPAVIERVRRVAIHGSDYNVIIAADWLWKNVVQPELAKKEEPGSAEAAWANKDTEFSPTVITMPSFLKKKDG